MFIITCGPAPPEPLSRKVLASWTSRIISLPGNAHPLHIFASHLYLCPGISTGASAHLSCGPVLPSAVPRIWMEPGSWTGLNNNFSPWKMLPKALTALLPPLAAFSWDSSIILPSSNCQPKLWLLIPFPGMVCIPHPVLGYYKISDDWLFFPNFSKFLLHQIIISRWSSLSSVHSLTSPHRPTSSTTLTCERSCFFTQAPQMFPDFIKEWFHGFWHCFAMSGTLILHKVIKWLCQIYFPEQSIS